MSNKIPPKINRHVMKALCELAEYYPNGIPLPEIIHQVKYQTRNLVPVANLERVVKRCIENYKYLGLLTKKSRRVYLAPIIEAFRKTPAEKRSYDRGHCRQRKRPKKIHGPGENVVNKMEKWKIKGFTNYVFKKIAPFHFNRDFYQPKTHIKLQQSNSSFNNYVDDGEQPCCSKNILRNLFDNKIKFTEGASTCSDNANDDPANISLAERVPSNENRMTNIASTTKVCSNDAAELLATPESFKEKKGSQLPDQVSFLANRADEANNCDVKPGCPDDHATQPAKSDDESPF